MKIIYTLLTGLICYGAAAQTFNGGGGAILNNGGQETTFTINVVGLSPAIVDSTFGLEEVRVDLVHPGVEELQLCLISPAGVKVDLSGVLSLKGSGFSGTIFNSGATTPVTSGQAPYSGTYRPVGNLGRVNNGKPGNGSWRLMIKDFVAGPNAGNLVSWSIRFGTSPSKPVVLRSSNLPLVFINTNNKPLTETEILVDLGIIDNGAARNNISDPKNNYNGKARINIRGSSSKMFEKNNLKVELTDASGVVDVQASLLGMPAESDWILTAAYNDKTLIRNALTHHLYRKMGHYSPRSRYVELILNGEYYGVYLLMEQIKRGKERVDIDKIGPMDNQFPYITGGYIIQINRNDDLGWYSQYAGISTTGDKPYFQYNYPRADIISLQQKAYIRSVIDSFETVLKGPGFADFQTGYRKYISTGSFIDFMIINELSKNADAYKLSTYIYKDNISDGGKMQIGPMWDYDIAWHNCNFGNAFSELYWQFEQTNSNFPIPTWWKRFMDDPKFKDELYCRYHSHRKYTLSNNELYEFIDATAALLQEAQQRNYRQFPILGTYIYPNPQNQSGATYASEVQDLKAWVSKRAAWLDNNVPGYCNNVALSETGGNTATVNVFPNPFSHSLRLEFQSHASLQRSVQVYNMLGECVSSQTLDPAQTSYELLTAGFPQGAYLIRISQDTEVFYRKVLRN